MPVLTFRARPMTSATSTSTSTDGLAWALGACQGEDPELFFPVTESRSTLAPTNGELAALTVCARCPLAQRQDCLNLQLRAGAANQWGVSGGMTAAQRRHLLRTTRPATKVEAQVARQLGSDVPVGSSTAAAPALPLAG